MRRGGYRVEMRTVSVGIYENDDRMVMIMEGRE